LLELAERRLAKFRKALTANQLEQVAMLAVWNYTPHWFYAVRLRLRLLAQDERDRCDLLDGLTALADVLGLEKEPQA
jgi:hypothetical protein